MEEQVNAPDGGSAEEHAEEASEPAVEATSGGATSDVGSPSPQPVPPGWYPDPRKPGSGQQRYWDGGAWTDKISGQGQVPTGAPIPAVSSERKSTDERKAMLAQQLQFAAARGRRIESQSDFQAVLVTGQPVNHTLHAILTIFTCLLWGIVWAIIAGTGGERREMVVVDEFGNVQYSALGKA